MRLDFQETDFHAAIVTSVVVFGFDGDDLKVLVANKVNEPFQGALILPTKVVSPGEAVDHAAKELLVAVTGKDDWYLEQLNAFARLYRNPAGRVINIAFYGLIKLDDQLISKLKKDDYGWYDRDAVPPLAYDHDEILEFARERLKRRVKRRPIGFSLLPREFTLNQLQRLYECALGKSFDKRNFRRKILKSELLIELEKKTDPTSDVKKPSQLYMFNEKKYRKMTLKGYDFVF